MVNISTTQKNYYKSIQDKALTPITKGHPFKGSTVNIFQKNGRYSDYDKNGKQTFESHPSKLFVIHTYYSGCVNQEYCSKDNTTEIRYFVPSIQTKWYRKKMNGLGSKDYSIEMNDIIITAGEFNLYIKKEVKHKGLKLDGNIDNIEELNNLRRLLSEFKRILKVNDLIDIDKTIINSDSEEIKLDPKKYFKLKQNK